MPLRGEYLIRISLSVRVAMCEVDPDALNEPDLNENVG